MVEVGVEGQGRLRLGRDLVELLEQDLVLVGVEGPECFRRY